MAKKLFYTKAFSSKRLKEVWKFVYRILQPKKHKINVDADELNNHYLTTASRILKSNPKSIEEIEFVINSSRNTVKNELMFHPVTFHEVLEELNSLRLDCSSGYDNIPVRLIKPIAQFIASPLTYIINMGIEEKIFHDDWKIGKITPIPKSENAERPDHYRPVTVLPILSKIYERLLAKQICKYIEENHVYKSTMSGFRKNHSTETLLMKIKDDMTKALEKGEVTLAMFLDFSKAFDTVDFKTLLHKLRKVGFSTESTMLLLSYLTNHQQ